MATGDAAAAAGLYVVPPTKDFRLGYDDINRRGDELANHMVNGTHPFTKITGTVTEAQLGNNTVSTVKLKDAAVTGPKIAAAAVATTHLASLAVTSPKIADGAVTTTKIGNGAVTANQIAALAVGTAKIADLGVTGPKIADGTINGDKVASTFTRNGTWNIQADLLVLRDETGTDKLSLGEAEGFDLRTNQHGDISTGGGFDLKAGFTATIASDTRVTLSSNGKSLSVDDTGVLSPSIYSATTSASANVNVGTDGLLKRSTSSRRYKLDIADADRLPKILDVQPRTFADKADPARHRTYGAIAEELVDLGLDALVVRDITGQPEAIAYDRVALALIPEVRHLRDTVTDLAARVRRLEMRP